MTAHAQHELITVRDFIRYAVSRFNAAQLFFGHGSDNAWDEAVYLTLHTLHLPLDRLEPFLDARLLPDERVRLLDLYNRRCQDRLPAAYLTHEAWLGEDRFYVDERVIVPRSFIAELLADAELGAELDAWLSPDTRRVLDLCTGNGSLAVLSAMAFPDIEVDAADISPDALAVAHLNVDRHGLAGRIRLVESDGLSAPALAGPYDLILCNPPYVNAASMAALPPEYLAEPQIALAGGSDGMDFVRQMLKDAPARMSPDAVLVLEIGNEREHFEAAFPQLEAIWLETSAGHDQVLLLTRAALLGS